MLDSFGRELEVLDRVAGGFADAVVGSAGPYTRSAPVQQQQQQQHQQRQQTSASVQPQQQQQQQRQHSAPVNQQQPGGSGLGTGPAQRPPAMSSSAAAGGMQADGGGAGRIGGGVPIHYVRTASGGYAATIATDNDPENDDSPLDDSPLDDSPLDNSPLTLRDMMSDMVADFPEDPAEKRQNTFSAPTTMASATAAVVGGVTGRDSHELEGWDDWEVVQGNPRGTPAINEDRVDDALARALRDRTGSGASATTPTAAAAAESGEEGGGGGGGGSPVPAPDVILGGSVSEAFIAVLPPAAAAATRRALTAAHVALARAAPAVAGWPPVVGRRKLTPVLKAPGVSA